MNSETSVTEIISGNSIKVFENVENNYPKR